jgi:hypothetical protein
MPAVHGDQHRGDHGLGQEARPDQMLGRRRLHHRLAGRAGTMPDDHPALGRDDVEPLVPVLADRMLRPVAARAARAVGFEHLFDPRQVGRQWSALGRCRPPRRRLCRIVLLFLSFGRRDGDLEVLQRQGELGGIELLGAPAELVASQRGPARPRSRHATLRRRRADLRGLRLRSAVNRITLPERL